MPARTPGDVLAEANARERDGHPEAARALLLAHSAGWRTVPKACHIKLGRLSLQLRDWVVAAHHLGLARDLAEGPVPHALRRDLAMALIRTGRAEDGGRELVEVLAEGGSISRPAFVMAIEAHRHRELRPNPYGLLAEAELMDEAKARGAAVTLLLGCLESLASVPAAYDAAIGRAALYCSDWALAADHLGRARDAWPGEVPGRIRRLLGVALHHLGQHEDAGRELDQALALGEDIPQLGLQLAINAHRAATGQAARLRIGCHRNYLFADPARKVAYLAIPKNACTILRTIFVLNSPHRDAYLASGKFIHDFLLGTPEAQAPRDIMTTPDCFRMVVLRDPLRRILSAYLDKFVLFRALDNPHLGLRVSRAVRDAQALLGIPDDPARSISFEEFVRYLAVTPDVRMDEHWMPQAVLVGDNLARFDHVGRVEQLDRTLDLLATRFGYTLERDLTGHVGNGNRHVRRYDDGTQMSTPWRALPADIKALKGRVPAAEAFYTEELRALLEQRYAGDFAMYAAAD